MGLDLCVGGEDDDAGDWGEGGEERGGEDEVAEVVGCEVGFDALGCEGVGWG